MLEEDVRGHGDSYPEKGPIRELDLVNLRQGKNTPNNKQRDELEVLRRSTQALILAHLRQKVRWEELPEQGVLEGSDAEAEPGGRTNTGLDGLRRVTELVMRQVKRDTQQENGNYESRLWQTLTLVRVTASI